MGYPLALALRYLGSKKRAFISVGTAFAVLGVTLGVAALATVMSVTGGFQAQLREKVLGVHAHVLVLKLTSDFREYRTIMSQVAGVPGVVNVAPFSINPMMLTHGDATRTGVLVKGVDPERSLGIGAPGTRPVLMLPRQILGCEETPETGPAAALACGQRKLADLRPTDAAPPGRPPGGAPGSPAEARAPSDAGHDGGPSKGPPSPPGALEADAGLLAPGAVEPDGGYPSRLPDDDAVLPPDVDPDRCTVAAEGAPLPGIVVGTTLARTLGVALGDCVTVASPTIGYSFSGGALKAPVARRFRVIALFEAGFEQFDANLVYTDLREAQTFGDQGDAVTGVELIVDDIDDAPRISDRIAAMLSNDVYLITHWEKLNHGLFTALRIQQIGMSLVLALIILVAAFTVVATLVMVVLHKKKEIAVMKAMGATDWAILRVFLYQGGMIGLAGVALGLLLGLAVCKGLLVYGFPLDPKVYFISHLPVQVRAQELLITGEIALAICLEATLLPSLYAANLSPVDAFRDASGDGRSMRWALTSGLVAVHALGVAGVLFLLIGLESGGRAVPGWAVAPAGLACAAIAAGALALCLRRR
jgi:lipoprotein-releasing system permease protein